MIRYTFRPLLPWTERTTEPRRNSAFRTPWPETLKLLTRELEYLDAADVVIQADFDAADLRLDGMPRAGARHRGHPGVRVAFGSRYGPLVYATDVCTEWQANGRCIALGLEALRKVDRYGVTKRGEQYTGWAQLGPGPSAAVTLTVDAARDVIALHAGLPPGSLHRAEEPEIRAQLRSARFATHPDRNAGDSTAYLNLEVAARLLGIIT